MTMSCYTKSSHNKYRVIFIHRFHNCCCNCWVFGGIVFHHWKWVVHRRCQQVENNCSSVNHYQDNWTEGDRSALVLRWVEQRWHAKLTNVDAEKLIINIAPYTHSIKEKPELTGPWLKQSKWRRGRRRHLSRFSCVNCNCSEPSRILTSHQV